MSDCSAFANWAPLKLIHPGWYHSSHPSHPIIFAALSHGCRQTQYFFSTIIIVLNILIRDLSWRRQNNLTNGFVSSVKINDMALNTFKNATICVGCSRKTSRVVQWHPLGLNHTYSLSQHRLYPQSTLQTSLNPLDYHTQLLQQTVVIFKKFSTEYSTVNTYKNESNHSCAHYEHNWHCFDLFCTGIYVMESSSKLGICARIDIWRNVHCQRIGSAKPTYIFDKIAKYTIYKSFEHISASFHTQKFQNTERILMNPFETNSLLSWDIHTGQKVRWEYIRSIVREM